jgi:hypothetical protein
MKNCFPYSQQQVFEKNLNGYSEPSKHTRYLLIARLPKDKSQCETGRLGHWKSPIPGKYTIFPQPQLNKKHPVFFA